MSSSRNHDSSPGYREERKSSENNETLLKPKRRSDIYSYSKFMKPPTHGNSDDAASDAGFSDYETRVSKKISMSGKRRGSAITTTNSSSYASDMSSSAGRSFSGIFFDQERVPEEKSDDDVGHRHISSDNGYAKSSSKSSRSKTRVERWNKRDYHTNVNNNTRVSSPYRDNRRSRLVKDHRSRREPRSRVDRHVYEPMDEKDLVEQVRYKLAECSERAKFQSPSRRRHKGRRSRSTKCDDLGNHESRGRKYRSRSPEDLRSPYKSPRRSNFRSPFQTPKDVHSVKRKSESRSVSPRRNSQSRSSSPDTRRGRHRRSRTSKSKYSSRENSPYRRREASSSERDLETVYQSRRRSKNNELMDSKSPKHSRRRHNISPERDEKQRRSKASRSKRGSGDDEKSLSRHRSESSYLGQRDQSTRSSRRRSRKSKKYYSPNRRDSSERFYSKERRSRGQSDSPDNRSNHSPNYRRPRVPKDRTVKFSDWRPECRLQNIEARGGKRDFRKWFKVLPPNVKVDKDVRTDRGVFKKDNFQSSQALDKYLGIKNSRSPVERRKHSSRSPGYRDER